MQTTIGYDILFSGLSGNASVYYRDLSSARMAARSIDSVTLMQDHVEIVRLLDDGTSQHVEDVGA